ncbi:hypothetical protein RHGRI_017224 [Rhododendron griersonianum]|uniref:Uncharacterized protein n=1 Tax=Rhododendron griersonianum TaxID=479676 RepID=A0AAV6JWZ5_9ERIC|nr:hypothetical protein RHGRI_017224 [Rhododendron griersonianum]
MLWNPDSKGFGQVQVGGKTFFGPCAVGVLGICDTITTTTTTTTTCSFELHRSDKESLKRLTFSTADPTDKIGLAITSLSLSSKARLFPLNLCSTFVVLPQTRFALSRNFKFESSNHLCLPQTFSGSSLTPSQEVRCLLPLWLGFPDNDDGITGADVLFVPYFLPHLNYLPERV